MTRYYTDHKFRDGVISAARQRNPRYLDLDGVELPAKLLTFLMKRDGGNCGICGEPVTEWRGPMRPSPDHVTPLSRGGKHEIENIQLSHLRCNLSKGARGDYDEPYDEYAQMIEDTLKSLLVYTGSCVRGMQMSVRYGYSRRTGRGSWWISVPLWIPVAGCLLRWMILIPVYMLVALGAAAYFMAAGLLLACRAIRDWCCRRYEAGKFRVIS